MKKDFEFMEHTADIKVKIYGDSLKDLYTNALKALFQTVLPTAKGCKFKDGQEVCSSFPIKRKISVVSTNRELLLVDFLSEVLSLMDTHDEAYGDVAISFLSDQEIIATLYGISSCDIKGEDVKAITYHELSIEKIDDQWHAIVIFDV